MEGDPYGRFNVTKNCTIVVANPLDWSVQSAYLLTIRSGVHNTRVKVELSDVEGYPPVYNETCETPVNPDGQTGDLLYSLTTSGEFVTTTVGCPVGKYGFLCHKTCICKNGARCHGFNGACKCPPGWKGVACDIPKQDVSITTTPGDLRDIYISANIMFHCKAHHVDVRSMSVTFPNATKNVHFHVNEIYFVVPNIQPTNSGPYTCQVRDTRGNTLNTTFVLNVTNCAPDTKGARCDEVCGCLQGASCDRWAGCVCPPGWTGTRCQTKCSLGTYGKNCARNCSCLNGASCSPSDGKCDCTDGWYGKDCSKPCPNGRFGLLCQQVCACKNNATCNNVDGSCACVTPWTGRNCDQLPSTDQPLLESLVSLGSLIVLVAIVMTILYKKGILACSAPDTGEEDKILFELRRMEQDLAQSLQPGWLGRWEKKIKHLTPGPLIGEGMFGLVRKGKLHTTEGELAVAAKTVRVEDSQSYRDFYREAAILVAVHQQRDGDCRESNIVRLVGLITKSAEKYILLEYASKGDLLGLLRRFVNINEKDLLGNILGYAVHIARALQELGRLRIAHRDVAARNVLITADDVAKLADFGLARDVYATTQYVRCNRPGVDDELLPLKWMALESIETDEYTCQSDVWSFGVLLWEIATLGKDPCYDGRMQLSFLQMVGILRQGIRLERPPGCPEDLYRLMRSCWLDVPDTRPTPEGIEERLLQLRRALLPHDVIAMETVV
ncbi:tyrosine-protein kinase receptor Tie-1-like [Branchiostoma floridae]|uniref:Tyrosine-protein kinase receptor Tie-1-like n=1 Tax=Branchiostoma floridae TaxID=7739 RepID=A0A9J7M469_BRAFL|nr:tyrosine-protein kinase receptor Tie-1-like [Branchiostoma floridae]